MQQNRARNANEEMIERAEARRLLRKLDAYETLALSTDPSRKPSLLLSAAELAQWRKTNCDLYRAMVGVDPSSRQELRQALVAIEINGQKKVRDAITEINRKRGRAVADR